MTALPAILWAKGRMGRHSMAALRHESWLKIGVVGSAATVLWFGALWGFAAGFFWLRNEGFAGEPPQDAITLAEILMARLLAIFALALFVMLIFSNVLIAYSTMYKAREVQYLLQAPIGARTFFLARFIECIGFSSWASAYLGTPLILAYGYTTSAHWSYYLAAVLFYVPFVVIPAAIGAVVTFILARVFPRLPRVMLFVLAAVALVVLFMYLRRNLSVERLAENSLEHLLLQTTMQTQSPLLPSSWAAGGVLAAAEGGYARAGFLWLLLTANALMATWIAAEAAHWLFLPGFSSLLGADRTSYHPLGRGVLGRLDFLFGFVRNPIRALIVKDIRLFWRDPIQWTQFFVFFGLMAAYIANLGNRSMDLASPAYRSWVASLNSGACALILASLTSRFVYPLISLEGFRFWILGLAPITRRQLVWQKFWLSVATTAPFTLGLTFLSCLFLEVSAIQFAVSMYTIACANFALAGLAVGLGSLYPNFEEDNPARIVSGMGGTLNFLLSVAYITLVLGSQMLILQWRAMQGDQVPYFGGILVAVLIVNSLLSAAAALIPMRIGLRNLTATEFLSHAGVRGPSGFVWTSIGASFRDPMLADAVGESSMQTVNIRTSKPTEFINIDAQLQKAIEKSGVKSGFLHVFVPHTTAGVTINENADPDVRKDLEKILERAFPWEGGYAHAEGNSAAHAKASTMGFHQTVFIEQGRMALGTWQSVFFCEFDGPRSRSVWIRVAPI